MMTQSHYEFFYRGQLIRHAGQSSPALYAILDGRVAILERGRVVNILEPGHCLTERNLPPLSGRVAVAHTNCRLVVINSVMFALLVQRPPEAVVQVLRKRLERATTKPPPQIRWPASVLARRAARQIRKSREQAGVYPVVRAKNNRPI